MHDKLGILIMILLIAFYNIQHVYDVHTQFSKIVCLPHPYKFHTQYLSALQLLVVNGLYLNILTEIAKAQIKKEKNISFDIDSIKRRFGV